MQSSSFKPVRNSELPASFRRVRLELARSADHPEGAPGFAYILVAPFQENGHIDATCWKANRDACRAIRLEPGKEDIRGHLLHRPGGGWVLHYDVTGGVPDELGFHFQDEAFVPGEYVSIVGSRDQTYRVASVSPL